jgi:hypothetical protein
MEPAELTIKFPMTRAILMSAPCCDSSDLVVSKQVKLRRGCNFEQIV